MQCETYTRLARESIAAEETDSKTVDLERIMDDSSEDKIFAAMGVAKTITTVSRMTSSSSIAYAASGRCVCGFLS